MEGYDTNEAGEEAEQRRALAAQLQEKLHQDQQLASKEQQNELFKSKLSLIKSRSKAKRDSIEKDGRHATTVKNASDTSPMKKEGNSLDGRQMNKSNKGKINVLREQLEQNRLRFERHGQQLNEDARSMEAVVEQLRHKLEDSDVTIQQLQAGQLQTAIPPAQEQVVEQSDIGSRLVEKEVQVNQLMTQNSDLQNTILELQENLKEKDCVIEARTRAITLLSEDMSKKWRANVDMLEETRQQMHIMQENFVSIESGLNKEIEQLNQQLEMKAKKLLQVEQSLKQTESARFDLATRNAELQEKVVGLQLHLQDESGLAEAQKKIEELSQALSDANRLAVKLKADHKTKVKTLTKQIDSLRKESSTSEEILQLQNHIAGLEEEKALQAQQLDQLQETKLQNEQVNSALSLDMERNKANIRSLEEVVADLQFKLADRDKDIDILKEKLDQAEMKIETEQTSLLLEEMKNELVETKCALQEWQARYDALEMEFQYQQVSLNHSELASSDTSKEKICEKEGLLKLSGLQSKIEEKELELEHVNRKLKTVETTLFSKVEHLESSFHAKRLKIQELESIIQANVEKLQSNHLVSVVTCDGNCADIVSLKNDINDRENHIKYLEDVVKNLQTDLVEFETLKRDFSEISHKLSSAQEKINSSEATSGCELCKSFENLKTKLMEISGELELKKEECSRLETKLKSQDEKLKKIAVNLKVKTVTNKELEVCLSKFEKTIEANEAYIQELSREKTDILEKWHTEVSEKNAVLSNATVNLAEKDQVINSLHNDLQTKDSFISELLSKLGSLEAEVDDLKIALAKEHKSSEELVESTKSQHHNAVHIASLQSELNLLQEQLSKETQEKSAALSKLESFTKNAKLKLAKEKKVRIEMQEKQVELENLLAEKTRVASEIHEKYQHDIANLQQELVALRIQEEEQLKISKHHAVENDFSPQTLPGYAEMHSPPSLETYEIEIESLCNSLSPNSELEILPLLEDEKKKTLDELQSTFEIIHSQIMSHFNQRSDLQGARKLFTELQNLVIRVRNRTAVLESKTNKFMLDFEEKMKNKLSNAQQRVEALESSMAELKEDLKQKEEENSLSHEKFKEVSLLMVDMKRLLEDEKNKSSSLEKEIECLRQSCSEYTNVVHSLEYRLEEKDTSIASLQCVSEEKQSLLKVLQEQNQERDSFVQDLQTTIQNQTVLVSTLQSQLQDKEFEYQNLQEELLKLNSMLNTLQVEAQEKTSVIDAFQLQVQEMASLQNRVCELYSQNQCLEEKVQELNAQIDNKEYHEKLLKAEQELEESVHKSIDQARQLEETSLKATNLEMQLLESSHKIRELEQHLEEMSHKVPDLDMQLLESSHKVKELEQQLFHISQEYFNQASAWSSEKNQFQLQVHDLTEQLQQAQISDGAKDFNAKHADSSVESDVSLRQQLAEKTAEVESYQQRLIQLQMGMSDSAPAIFSAFTDSTETDSLVELNELRKKVKELQEALDQQKRDSSKVLDDFNTESVMVGTSEMAQLNNQLTDLSREVDTLLSEKKKWEEDKQNMSDQMLSLTEKLQSLTLEKERVETELKSVCDLKARIKEMSLELDAANNIVAQVPELQVKENKQFAEIQELHEKLESVQVEKGIVQKNWESLCEQLLSLEMQVKGAEVSEGRPCIPQTLDTHVSSLQTGDSELYEDYKESNFVHGAMDESLMEHNITQLESELSGMVTSQLEVAEKQKGAGQKKWKWDGKGVRESGQRKKVLGTTDEVENEKSAGESGGKLIASLRVKLEKLKYERDYALAEVAKLQLEIKNLSQNNVGEVANPPVTDTSISVDQGWAEEDSWGWGADNAKLEEQHQHQKCQEEKQTVCVTDELQSKIKSLESEKEILESDKLKLMEDLKASQLRSAKLTRKFKDLKLKYDEVADRKKSSEAPLDSLDLAIEEERTKQMQSLEKELKDVQMELSNARSERDKLQKQVEVFSSANDRMLEAKERQDVEIEMWQKRSKDLTNQVQALERKIQEQETKVPEVVAPAQVAELQIHSISSDTLNPTAVGQLLKENHTWNTSYEALMLEYQKLRAQHISDTENKVQIDALVAQQKGMIDRLEHEKSYLQNVYDNLKMELEEANAQLTARLEDQNLITVLTEKNTNLLRQSNECEQRMNETLSKLQVLNDERDQLQEQLVTTVEQSQKELSGNVEELSRLREELLSLKSNSDHSTSTLSKQVNGSNVVQSPILKWDCMVSDTAIGQESVDIFDSIAANSFQTLEKEDQSSSVAIQTIQTPPFESQEEWSNTLVKYKNELDAARQTIIELQLELESCSASSRIQKDLVEHNTTQDIRDQELLTQMFMKEREIESLQISLAISEEARRKLENNILLKDAVVEVDGKAANTPEPGDHPPQASSSSSERMNPSISKDVALVPVSPDVEQHTDRSLLKELDLALLRLYERDVRCDELTLELTRLLEERDGLQLRLSNAIRTNEDMRDRLNESLSGNYDETSHHHTEHHLTSSAGSSNESAVENVVFHHSHLPDASPVSKENKTGLERKLGEIHTVHYGRDKWLREDQELRHQQQMQLLYSSHSTAVGGPRMEVPSTVQDDVALIEDNVHPPDGNDSSSNEAQGSFLGWLWGRS